MNSSSCRTWYERTPRSWRTSSRFLPRASYVKTATLTRTATRRRASGRSHPSRTVTPTGTRAVGVAEVNQSSPAYRPAPVAFGRSRPTETDWRLPFTMASGRPVTRTRYAERICPSGDAGSVGTNRRLVRFWPADRTRARAGWSSREASTVTLAGWTTMPWETEQARRTRKRTAIGIVRRRECTKAHRSLLSAIEEVKRAGPARRDRPPAVSAAAVYQELDSSREDRRSPRTTRVRGGPTPSRTGEGGGRQAQWARRPAGRMTIWTAGSPSQTISLKDASAQSDRPSSRFIRTAGTYMRASCRVCRT